MIKLIKQIMNKIIQNLIAVVTGFLSNLTTTNKSNLVAAINEVNAKPTGGTLQTAFDNSIAHEDDPTIDSGDNGIAIQGNPGSKMSFRNTNDDGFAIGNDGSATVTASTDIVINSITNQYTIGTQVYGMPTSGGSVGQSLKIASIDGGGRMILEWG